MSEQICNTTTECEDFIFPPSVIGIPTTTITASTTTTTVEETVEIIQVEKVLAFTGSSTIPLTGLGLMMVIIGIGLRRCGRYLKS